MRREHVAAGVAVMVLGFVAAACGATDGGTSSGRDAVSSPVKAAVASPSAAAPAAMVAGQLGVIGQDASDVGMVLGRSDTLQQAQLLQQQRDVAAASAQATTSAPDTAALFCG
jgi:hypothetical protein